MVLVLAIVCASIPIIAFRRPGEQDRYLSIRFMLSGACTAKHNFKMGLYKFIMIFNIAFFFLT